MPRLRRSCEDVRCGNSETGVVDVTHRGAYHQSRHRYPRLRPNWIASVSDPLSASRPEARKSRISSTTLTRNT